MPIIRVAAPSDWRTRWRDMRYYPWRTLRTLPRQLIRAVRPGGTGVGGALTMMLLALATLPYTLIQAGRYVASRPEAGDQAAGDRDPSRRPGLPRPARGRRPVHRQHDRLPRPFLRPALPPVRARATPWSGAASSSTTGPSSWPTVKAPVLVFGGATDGIAPIPAVKAVVPLLTGAAEVRFEIVPADTSACSPGAGPRHHLAGAGRVDRAVVLGGGEAREADARKKAAPSRDSIGANPQAQVRLGRVAVAGPLSAGPTNLRACRRHPAPQDRCRAASGSATARVGGDRRVRHRARPDAAAVPHRHPRHRRGAGPGSSCSCRRRGTWSSTRSPAGSATAPSTRADRAGPGCCGPGWRSRSASRCSSPRPTMGSTVARGRRGCWSFFLACATAYAFFQVPYVAMPAEITDVLRRAHPADDLAGRDPRVHDHARPARPRPLIRDAVGGRDGYRVMGVVDGRC